MRGIVHGGKRAGGGGDLPSFFGDGSDGVFNSASNETIVVTEHTGIAVKQYTSFTLNAGHAFTVDKACQGLLIYVDGDVLVDGNLSMTAKGSYLTEPSIPAIQALFTDLNRIIPVSDLKGGAGGAGGAGGSASFPGGAGGGGRLLAGGFGGGGGGGAIISGSAKNASAGGAILISTMRGDATTAGAYMYSDSETENGNPAPLAQPGCGGGGGVLNTSTLGTGQSGGIGGRGKGAGGGGGGGGYQTDGNLGLEGQAAGGFLCIIASGSITIGATGIVEAKGGAGGKGGNAAATVAQPAHGGGGGGGAGGGILILACAGSYTKNGTLSVAGGAGGAGGSAAGGGVDGAAGTAGSAGKIIEETIVE